MDQRPDSMICENKIIFAQRREIDDDPKYCTFALGKKVNWAMSLVQIDHIYGLTPRLCDL